MFNKERSSFITKLLIAPFISLALSGVLITADSHATTWPKQTSVVPDSIEALRDDAIAVNECNGTSHYESRSGAWAQAFIINDTIKTSGLYGTGSSAFNPQKIFCDPSSSVSIADGSQITSVKNAGSYDVVLERNGREVWGITPQVCPTKSVQGGYSVAMEQGSDGKIYAYMRSIMGYSDCTDKLLVINPSDGSSISIALSVPSSAASPVIYTFNGEVAVVDSHAYVYYFDNGGVLDHKSTSPLSGEVLWADAGGRIYTRNNSGCSSQDRIRAYTSTGSTSIDYNIPNSTEYCTQTTIAALPDGGIATAQMVGANVAVTTYDSSGTGTLKYASVEIGYSEEISQVIADEDRKVVVVTRLKNSMNSFNGFVVRLFDTGAGTVTTLWNAKDDVSGVSSFEMRSDPNKDSFTDNYLFLALCHNVACYPNSQNAWIHKVALAGFGNKYQSTGAFSLPTGSTERKYVALGDSFSSGEGNPAFIYGTDSASNECHRSLSAYPSLLSQDSNADLDLVDFVACSGATTSNVLSGGSADGAWGEPAQVDALLDDTEIVTITIGGNDVGFKDFVTACVVSTCAAGAGTAYTNISNAISSTSFSSDLQSTYLAILNKALSAEVYVIGYPHLIGGSHANGCNVLGSVSPFDEELSARSVTDQLNYQISTVIGNIKQNSTYDSVSSRLHYVGADQQDSPFIGHDLCQLASTNIFFHDFSLTNPLSPFAFHPNAAGHTAYGQIVANEL